MQRNFEPMRKQVEAWQRSERTDVTAKVVIYEATCMTCTSSRYALQGATPLMRCALLRGACLQDAEPVDQFEGFLVDMKVHASSQLTCPSLGRTNPFRLWRNLLQ
jgi:hypothetical protein